MVENCPQTIRETGAEFDLSGCGGTWLADPGLLRIALSDLISNAMKYAAARILVRDNGIGIATADQEREYGALGLGLAPVVESSAGNGTTFGIGPGAVEAQ